MNIYKFKKWFELGFFMQFSIKQFNLPTGGTVLSRHCLSSRLYTVEITLAPLCCAN